MAILARLGVNIAANIGFQYAAEMLPTVVRAQGVSLIHIIGYAAHIIGPYVIYLVSIPKDYSARSTKSERNKRKREAKQDGHYETVQKNSKSLFLSLFLIFFTK